MTKEIFFEKHKVFSYGILDVFRQRMNLYSGGIFIICVKISSVASNVLGFSQHYLLKEIIIGVIGVMVSGLFLLLAPAKLK
jgi:hypothetical protein